MKSCFFTGHRYFSAERDTDAVDNLTTVLPILAESGVTDFYCGGARGWDTYCGFAVSTLKKYYPQIKLHLILPCPAEKQIFNWKENEIKEYTLLLQLADSFETVSKEKSKDCMKKRNSRLVELGGICICYFNKKDTRSGTAQTVRMAEKANKTVLNMFSSLK